MFDKLGDQRVEMVSTEHHEVVQALLLDGLDDSFAAGFKIG